MEPTLEAVRDPGRLAALRATALVDSEPEEAFDRLTRLASHVLGVPVALVSLVEEDRQFFKSCIGLAPPASDARGTPLSQSFCQHAVASREPLIVEDAREDPRLSGILAASDLKVVAYAGFPLITADGDALGTFCAIDLQPRRWTEEEIDFVREMAASAMTEIELRTALRELEDARAEAEGALVMLRELQAIGDKGLSRLDLAGLLHELIDRVMSTLEADAAAIVLDDDVGGERILPAARGMSARDEALVRSLPESPDGDPLLLGAAELAALAGGDAEPGDLQSLAAVPLAAEGRALGLLAVGWRSVRRAGDDELKLMALAAERAAYAVDRALTTRGAAAETAQSELVGALERERSAAEHDADERARLLAHTVAAQEEERRRIAMDVHDDYLQALTAVRMHLESVREELDGERRERVGALAAEMSGAIERMRGLVFDLRPPALDWAGVASAVRMFLQDAERRWGFRFKLESRLADEPPEAVRLLIYRIVQEAVTNAGKHAGASLVEVTLAPSQAGIAASVRDDGCGLDPAEPPSPRHFGLAGMRERAETAGGWWRIESAPGEGTTVEFWVPASPAPTR